MQCKCLEVVTKQVTERMKDSDRAGPDAKVECGAVALTLGKTLDERVYIPFNVTSSKVGYRSQKGKEIPVYCTYCPFCGKPAGAPEEKTNAPS